MTAPTIRSLDTVLVRVNHRGDWLHLRIEDSAGVVGLGEASHGGFGPDRDAIVEAILQRQVKPLLLGADPRHTARLSDRLRSLDDGLAAATAVSAADQALWDLAAKRAGIAVAAMLGDAAPAPVALYANINRSVTDRSPAGFAAKASAAVAEGHTRIKIAPFDGIDQRRIREPDRRQRVELGIACAAAVREAIGPDRDLMIDCHSAFDPGTAHRVAHALADLGITWFEEPLPLTDPLAYASLRHEVHRLGMEMVGGELLFGVEGFLPWLRAGAFDVIMPDIKHCGGVTGLRAIGDTARAFGVSVAPHNPSGPLATLATAHALAALPGHRPLEIAWGEVPRRNDVVGGAEDVRGDRLHLPDAPGFGVAAIHRQGKETL
jgi:galactonate dehydratase